MLLTDFHLFRPMCAQNIEHSVTVKIKEWLSCTMQSPDPSPHLLYSLFWRPFPLTLLHPLPLHLWTSTSSEKPWCPFPRLGWAPLTPCHFLGSACLAVQVVHRIQLIFIVVIDAYFTIICFPWMAVVCLEQGVSCCHWFSTQFYWAIIDM